MRNYLFSSIDILFMTFYRCALYSCSGIKYLKVFHPMKMAAYVYDHSDSVRNHGHEIYQLTIMNTYLGFTMAL